MNLLSNFGVDYSAMNNWNRGALFELASSPRAWVIGGVVGVTTLTTFSIVKFYWSRRNYPPGPFPWPFLGNVKNFHNTGHFHETVLNLSKDYGSVMTLWFNNSPVVMLCDHEAGMEAYRDKKTDFAGRTRTKTNDIFLGNEGSDIIFADYGREWEVLRRVAHSASRKYAVNDQLPLLVAEVVDEAIMIVVEKHGSEPFDFNESIYLIVYNILAQSAYGTRYSINDAEFIRLKYENDQRAQMASQLLTVFFIPFFRHFNTSYKKFVNLATGFREFLASKYREHLDTFEEGNIRDFCDALIAAKKEAELEDKDALKYLTDINLSLTLLDLFSAGTDTTKITLQWIVLFIANFPYVQRRLREELEIVVGDDVVTLDHRDRLDYCRAFISEAMRFRPVQPLGLGHKTIVDTSVAGHRIKKGTTVLFAHYASLHDPKLWHKPEVFNPDRFIDAQGIFMPRVEGNVPFGIGRRMCLGEKLALTNLLFITCRILQATKGFTITLPDGPGSADLYGNEKVGMVTKDYKIMLKRDVL